MKYVSLTLTFFFFISLNAQAAIFQIGAAKSDITGPATEVGMMGYARTDQQTSGLHMRLYARAFVIKESKLRNSKSLAYVVLDTAMITQAVKLEVVKRLKKRFAETYTEKNVMLSATHTHSVPGGYSHYTLYNLTSFGFSKQNFEAVVNGTVNAITKAHYLKQPAKIYRNSGMVENAAVNRSLPAYRENLDALNFPALDKEMTILKFKNLLGMDIGMISWFAVHCTSMGNRNELISGDNKGWAAYTFEKAKGKGFIAAFANGAEGDISPNIHGGEDGGGKDDFESTKISGEKQFNVAWELYHAARKRILNPNLEFRHEYYDFSKTAYAALGVAFAAGAEDGPSKLPFIREGHQSGTYDEAHGLKPIFLKTGKMTPYPWTPEVLPSQMFTIGDFAILGVPGEFTTHAGRRLKNTTEDTLKNIGIQKQVISGLSNAYAGYVTTREEYNEQHYEGASTHFGQWTLKTHRERFAGLVQSLKNKTKLEPGPTPRDLAGRQKEIQPGVLFDAPPIGKEFGDVNKDASEKIKRGETAQVVFWGAHLKNDLKTGGTFLKVQKKTPLGWQTIAKDSDLTTKIFWKRYGIAASKVTVLWETSMQDQMGTYRIIHEGVAKKLTGLKLPYKGTSREFNLF